MKRHSFRSDLALCIAFAASLTLAGCYADRTPSVNSRHMQPLSDKMLTEIENKNMTIESAILIRIFKEELELEGLEGGQNRTLCAFSHFSDLPLVGRARPKDQGRRSPGARGLLHHYARADESQFQLLSGDQYGFSERI